MARRDGKSLGRIIFTGPPGSGKTRSLLQLFNQARQDGREDRVLFIVPDASAREHVRDLIARFTPDGVPSAYCDKWIVSIGSLVRSIAGSTTAGLTHCRALVSKWVADGSLGTEGTEILSTDGGRKALCNALMSLRSYGHTYDSVSRVERENDSLLLTALRLWEEWLTEEGKRDEQIGVNTAVKNVESGSWDLVLIDGFTEINPLQWRLVEKICSGVQNVAAAIDPDQMPSNELLQMFIKAGFKEERFDSSSRWDDCEDLRWLADVGSWDIHACRPETCPVAPSRDRMKVLSASNPLVEAAAIAREVTKCVNDGYSYSDIAILAPDLGRSRYHLASAFKRAGIPLRFYVNQPLRETGPGALVDRYLKILSGDWSDATVCSLLAHPSLMLSADSVCSAIHHTQAVSKLGSSEAWLEWASGAGHEVAGLINELANLQSVGEFDPVEYTELILESCGEKIRASWKDIPDEILVEEGWAWDGMKSVLLDSAHALHDVQDVLASDVIARFMFDELSDAQGKPLDRRRDCVNAVTLLAARTWGVKVAIVSGLAREYFPHRPSPNPFLPDSLREGLDPKLPTYDELKDREEALFRIAVTRARDRLILTWPMNNTDGNPLLKSGPLEKCVEWLYGDENPEIIEHEPPIDPGECLYPSDVTSIALERGVEAEKIPGFDSTLAITHAHYDAPTIQNGEILSTAACGNNERPISPTGLNHLVQCPYRFFANRVLKLREPDRDSVRDGFDYRTWGIIAHAALAEWFRGGKTEDFRDLVDEVAADLTCLAASSVTEARKRQIVDTLNRFRKFEQEVLIPLGYRQVEAELAFDSSDPVSFEIDQGYTLTLGGRIDRVDVREDKYALVADYKRSRQDAAGKSLKDGRDFQLACYITLVKAGLGLDVELACFLPLNKITADGTGTVIHNPDRVPPLDGAVFRLDDELTVDGHLQFARESLGRLIRKISSGEITPYPRDSNLCGNKCAYVDLCRYRFTGDEGLTEGGADE